MPPGRNPRGPVSAGGRGGGSGRGGGGRGRGRGARRGRGGRSSGRGTALPSSFTGRGGGGGGTKGDDRRRRGGGDKSSAGYAFDDGGGRSDRHKYDDEAGDSDDGPGPEDSDFEDEEVDEDAAFDSADEARYGEIMDTILERRSGKQGGSDEEGEEEGGSSDDDGGEGGGGMSVMDMLAANEAAEAAKNDPSAGKGKEQGKGKGRANGGGGTEVEESNNRTAPSSGVSSAAASGYEAGFDGDAMDEDMPDDGDGSEEEEDSDEDEGEDGEDEEERHARLLGFVGTLGDQAAAAQRAAEDRRASQLLKEGEFNATSGGAGGGGAKKGAVTMETLMGSLQNSKGFAAVKKQVAAFSGKSGAPSAPVSKTAELRAERETAYDSRKSDMGKWVAPVQANRQAETLDFAPAVKTNLSNAALASKMQPTTDMEKEVEMLLTAGGATEAGLADKEMEELKSKAYTVEEVKERQTELSKMRALMFYQERKQHHMNKIKSKVYRKIKKRQRDRAGDSQLEADGELGEVAARKRAEERMSLRHKNTTKWVKNALRAKGGAGKDDRKAIAEQLQLGQELRAKMDGVDNNSSDDDSSSEEEGEQEDARKNKSKKRKSALTAADREELEGIGGEGEDEDGVAAGGKGAAILKMAFMQKAMNKQRERAREEASVVLRELEEASAAAAAEDGSSDDESRGNGGKGKGKGREGAASSSWGMGDGGSGSGGGVSTRASAAVRAKAAAEVAKALPAGTLQSSAVSMDARVRSSVASPITIDLGGGGAGGAGGGSNSSSSTPSTELKTGAGDGKAVSLGRPGDSTEEEGGGADKSNPWLAPIPRRSKERRRASNGAVLLDVRKAAATALSAFGGTDDAENVNGSSAKGAGKGTGGEAGSSKPGAAAKDGASPGNGRAGQGKGRRKRRRSKGGGGKGEGEATGGGAGSTKPGAAAKDGTSPGNGQAEQGQGKERKKKRKRSEGGGGGGGLEGTGDGRSGKSATEDTAVDAKEAGGNSKRKKRKKKQKVAKGGPGEAGVSEDAGKTNGDGAPAAKKREGKDGGGGESSAETTAGAKEAGGNSKKKNNNKKRKMIAKTGQAGGGVASSKLVGLSNDELVRRAFAAPDFESEFKDSKDDEIEAVLSKGREKLPGTLDGWGSWAGDGAPVPRGPTKRQVVAKKVQAKKEETLKKARKDDRLPKVVLNEKRQKRSAKYMVSEVPYPFTSREQYERSLRQPIGGEWNTSQSVRAMTRPAVVVRAGVAVNPMKLGKLHRDNAKDKNAQVATKRAKEGETGKTGKTRGGAGRRRGSKGGSKDA